MYKQKPPMRILKSVRHLPSTHTHTRTREKKKTTNVMNKESRNWAFVERKNSLPDNFNVKSIFSTLLIMYEMHTNIFLSCEYSNYWISRVYLCLLTSVRVCLFFLFRFVPVRYICNFSITVAMHTLHLDQRGRQCSRVIYSHTQFQIIFV